MFLLSIISSFILLESIEVGQSMLSQPFLMSIILILLGFDPHYVLTTATSTHLYFIYYVPSGASKYPEYPFAFFVVITSSKLIFEQFQGNIGILMLLSFALIVILSRVTAYYVYFKRKIINRFSMKLIDNQKTFTIRHHMLFSVTSSIISGSVFAFVLMVSTFQIFKLYSNLLKHDIEINNLILVILLGIFAPYFFSKNKLKAFFIGVIIAVVFYLIVN